MKLGVNLINFGPGASPDSLEGWVDMAQGLGYHGLLTSDHVTITHDVSERYPAPFYEPLSMLGWLAAKTSDMMIGTTVSTPTLSWPKTVTIGISFVRARNRASF